MLQVPPVHVVELREILVVAGDQADCFHDRVSGPQQDEVSLLTLCRESPHGKGIVVILVRPTWFPRPRIAWPDQADAVPQEEGRI